MNLGSKITQRKMYATTFFDSEDKARSEVRKRRGELSKHGFLIRYEDTIYGNWRVYAVPLEEMVEVVIDAPTPSLDFNSLGSDQTRSRWIKITDE